MANEVNTTSQDIQNSVSSIYRELLERRKEEKERKSEQRRFEKEENKESELESINPIDEENRPLSKKEKRAKELDSWKEIVVGLTGDDLDYIPQKKNKRKYKKWIDDDINEIASMNPKPEKKKKKNYNKEFEPELNMLRSIVADQNRFTTDLQKRYANTAGPNTKDAMPLNKTLVELASVINNSRSNSLGVLREIGNLKKTIADLYMKQKKLDQETGGAGFASQDLTLTGSSLATELFNSGSFSSNQPIPESYTMNDSNITPFPNHQMMGNSVQGQPSPTPTFDPSSWSPEGIVDVHTKYEAIPHKIVVEWHKEEGRPRFKAIREDNGEELIGCPVPTCDIKSIDEDNMMAKDVFDQVYAVEVV